MQSRMSRAGQGSSVDPITLEVIRGGLVSLCSEMGIAMERSSYSPIFSEGLDYSYAMFDGKAEMIAQAAFDPCHLGAMPYSVRASINEIGLENLEPGDVILHNDPFNGGSHISDFTAILPVFYDGKLVAIPACRGHQIDAGAMVPGGFAGDATDIFQEGRRIPPIKIVSKGIEVPDLWKLILANVRLPKSVQGDLRAMFGALRVGEKRIIEYLDKYGQQTWDSSLSEIKSISERIMRDEISKIPRGFYEYEDYIDDTGRSQAPHKIHLKLEVKDGEITADYSGSSPQLDSPINAAFAVTAGNTVIGILHSIEISGDYVVNQGTFRPIEIRAPKGTIVNPDPPAPLQGGNTELSNRIVDTVIGALAQATEPVRIKAACHGTDYGMTVGGLDPRTNSPYVIYMWSLGGMGARAAGDGNPAQLPFATNNKGVFIEINEIRYPLIFEEYSLAGYDSSGPGKYRGGIGTKLVWRLRAKECILSCLSERHKISPYGVFGGFPPLPREDGHFSDTEFKLRGRNEFIHAGDAFGKISPSKWSNATIHEGDTVEILLSCGGGWGDPLERDPYLVLSDVRSGFLSSYGARQQYGVIIDAERSQVDLAATEELRRKTTWPDLSTGRDLSVLLTLKLQTSCQGSDLSDSLNKISEVKSVRLLSSGGIIIKVRSPSNEHVPSILKLLRELPGVRSLRILTIQFFPANQELP